MPAKSADDVLLDTHVLLWWQAGSRRLSQRARLRISTVKNILVSPISCWEVAILVAKDRVRLDRPTAVWVRDLLAQDRVLAAQLTPAIAVAAAELADFHGDPADRLLYATARSLQAELLSKDRMLREYAARQADVTVVW
jgi:PIN domain nuclease of toxin-antitoxin system